RADQNPVIIADEGQDDRQREDAEERRDVRQRRANRAGVVMRGNGGDRCHHTLRAVEPPNRPCGAASRTTMNSVKTATEEKMPPTRKFAACWNRPSASPPAMAPRLLPSPPSATGTKP